MSNISRVVIFHIYILISFSSLCCVGLNKSHFTGKLSASDCYRWNIRPTYRHLPVRVMEFNSEAEGTFFLNATTSHQVKFKFSSADQQIFAV